MWSIGNEIKERTDSSGVEIAKKLKSIVRKHDMTRPVTAAINHFWDNPHLQWKDSERAFSTLDVSGYNYTWQEYESDMKLFPNRVIYGVESYPMERADNWDLVEKYPGIIGDFVWTAIDYLGESGIGHALEVKAVGVESGAEQESVIIRTAGTPEKIRLTPDRALIENSRNDLSYIRIELVDKDGLIVLKAVADGLPETSVEVKVN